ncbi:MULTISPECIES: DedA family protein [Cohnella]|uniref:DedA family protein n=1 Tax=Cohnella TaxID=329857 RepID=UPI0009BA9840|nr:MULTISPECIES: DedA family protein [Cohnella]MBN2981432.1 DedA family protein [Cohnella algarum]
MELLEYIERLFSQYGYWVLLIGLPLDAIALPIPPGNTTLALTGYLASQRILAWLPALGSAYSGAVIGITATYWLGRKIGAPLVERYGKWLFLKPDHVAKTRKAYDRYGSKVLLFSYFLPGIRQFIGYFAGIIQVPYRSFALYAYTGCALWVSAFFLIGYGFGDQWEIVFGLVERYMKFVFAGLCAAAAVVFGLKWRRSRLERAGR